MVGEVGRIYSPSLLGTALRQGEILSNLIQLCVDLDSLESDDSYLFNKIAHPLVIIVSQDCDLEQDSKSRLARESHVELTKSQKDKLIPSILFCDVFPASDLAKQIDNSKIWGRININKDERYHYFQKIESSEDATQEGFGPLGVDFKKYFSIPSDEVHKRLAMNELKRHCTLLSPYLEHFSTRYSYYQFRVALPEEHIVDVV